jgi:hypothetical protein
MKEEWKSPNTIIGPVATGNYYYKRPEIVNEIWDELEKGNYILIAAPRRVGKTSVMKNIEENPRENFKVIFENVQSLKSENDFYKELYKLILKCLSNSKKIKNWFKTYISSKSITEIDINGSFKISHLELNYLNEINNIIPQIDKNGEIIILLIDELPEVLHNLNKNNKKDEAISILKNLRRWRQESQFNKLRFVLAGSIGIHYVVNTIEGRNSDLNDLKKVQYHPIEIPETDDYFDWATKNASVKYNEELRTYFLEKIQYFVPYFFNILLDEIDKQARKENNQKITKQTIDDAFDLVIKHNDYFSDWKKRLSDYLPKEDFKFVNEILIHIAHKNQISIQEIYNKAEKYDKTIDYMDFVNDLEQDGYIVEQNQKYIFISAFLKEFWKRNNPIYNG